MAALRAGDPAAALPWLDRARRLAPGDPTIRLSLATAWLERDAGEAARLFQDLLRRRETAEAWLGLATARARLGDSDGAAAARNAAARRRAESAGEDEGSEASVRPSPPAPSSLARPPPVRVPPMRDVDIVVPVYGGVAATLACLDSVLTHRPRRARVIVIDDASPEPELARALDRLAARRRIVLVRHRRNRGFPAAANAGLARARASGRDALLLNADTLVAAGFVARLRQAAYAAADIASACPLSNNATILSYPEPADGNAMPDQAETARLARLAWAAAGARVVDLPTAVGFCMYLRLDALRAVGRLRTDLFGRGYGEENDWCARASDAGWRHVAAVGVFVAHEGEASFGAAAVALRDRNEDTLARLHPDYRARVAAHVRADPLFETRRALDLARWRDEEDGGAGAVVLVTHGQGGGVARSVAARAAALRAEGLRPVVLLPAGEDSVRVEGFPNLRFRLPAEQPALLRLLRESGTRLVEFHHLLGHAPAMHVLADALAVPHEVHVHDYHFVCPRIALSGARGHYCGEPDLTGCRACVRARGSLLGEAIDIVALRARAGRMLAAARAVIVPSHDTAARLARYFPALAARVEAPVDQAGVAAGSLYPLAPRVPGRRRVVVAGAIGPEKGYGVLLAMARDAAARGLGLEFVVVGHTAADAPLLGTGRVFITGPYRAEEAVGLIRAQQGDLGLLPSVVPETWCHALSELWAAGLAVVGFDLGAQAERIAGGGRGMVLPPGLAPGAINRALLAARL